MFPKISAWVALGQVGSLCCPSRIASHRILGMFIPQAIVMQDHLEFVVADPCHDAGHVNSAIRALDSHSHDESDRVGVRHGAPEASQDEGLGLAGSVFDDGVQADGKCLEKMASVERFNAHRGCDRRRSVRRRCQKGRRLIRWQSTTFDHISRYYSCIDNLIKGVSP